MSLRSSIIKASIRIAICHESEYILPELSVLNPLLKGVKKEYVYTNP